MIPNDVSTEERDRWARDPLRMPTIGPEDRLIFSEHGRVITNVERRDSGTDYRSHWLCLVQTRDSGPFAVLVKHGAGEERIGLGYGYKMRPIVEAMQGMTPDARYLLMYSWMDVYHDSRRGMEEKWRRAVAEGRVKRQRIAGGTRECARYAVFILEPQKPVAKVAA